MVSKKKISKNNNNDESVNELITEEEKQMLKQLYLQQKEQNEELRNADVQDTEVQPKMKRQISDAQRESLVRAREMALLKKKELKEITEKKKIIQQMKKDENKLDVETEYNETLKRVGSKVESKKEEVVVEKRKIKKIIYEDEEDENNNKFSYSDFTKKSAMDQMKDKINEDRLKFLYQKYILR
jgi:hypothetical protein